MLALDSETSMAAERSAVNEAAHAAELAAELAAGQCGDALAASALLEQCGHA